MLILFFRSSLQASSTRKLFMNCVKVLPVWNLKTRQKALGHKQATTATSLTLTLFLKC